MNWYMNPYFSTPDQMLEPPSVQSNFESLAVNSDSSNEETIEVLLSLQGVKSTHFNVTPINEIFIGTSEGHIQVSNFAGKHVKFITLLSLKTEQVYKGNNLPPGATLNCSSISNEQGLIWVGCVYGLICIYDLKFNRLASIEMQGVEWTACHYSTSKISHAIFGTRTGKLYNFRHSKHYGKLELAYLRDTPLFETKDVIYTCRVNQIVALKERAGAYAVATDQGFCMVMVDVNDIVVTMNRVWLMDRDVQCVCEADYSKFLVAYDQLSTLSLIDVRSDLNKAVKEFKLKQNYTNGTIADILKTPMFTKERPIVIVRSEGSLFLFNLKTRGYTKLASAASLDCNTR